MSLRHPIALVFASVSFGLVGCGDSPRVNPVDAGRSDAADAADVPTTAVDAPRADAGSPLVLTATLTGRQVVPPVYDSAASGTVTFMLSADRTLVSYMVTHTILLPTSTRLHLGLAGEAGTVMLALVNGGGPTVGSTGLTPDQARAIAEGRTYVNIASAAFPEGELRGQLVEPGETVYTARLSTDQENPPNMLTSRGVAEVLVDATAGRLRFAVRTTGMPMPPTGAHIHTGPAGVDGPVLIGLSEGATPLTSEFVGTRPLTASTLADLEAGRWYVNIHSPAFPAGEIRGQILRPGERLYIGRMSGLEEVPPTVTTAAGTVGVIVSANRDSVSYDGVVTGVTPMSAHLHAGAVGMVGAPVIPLTIMGESLRGTSMVGAGGSLLMGLEMGTIYANVHSAMYPMGEIRGQMRPAPATP